MIKEGRPKIYLSSRDEFVPANFEDQFLGHATDTRRAEANESEGLGATQGLQKPTDCKLFWMFFAGI